MQRTPLVNEAELQAREQWFVSKQHSYELTQKLTYYVISVELIFCGYMLLNADKFASIHGTSYLFGTSGIAALFGILWRFFYNQTYHNNAHGIEGLLHKISSYSQIVFYWIYTGLSIIAFAWALYAGFNYLNVVHESPKSDISKQTIKVPTQSLASLSNTSNLS
jgi:hypothetical protein